MFSSPGWLQADSAIVALSGGNGAQAGSVHRQVLSCNPSLPLRIEVLFLTLPFPLSILAEATQKRKGVDTAQSPGPSTPRWAFFQQKKSARRRGHHGTRERLHKSWSYLPPVEVLGYMSLPGVTLMNVLQKGNVWANRCGWVHRGIPLPAETETGFLAWAWGGG